MNWTNTQPVRLTSGNAIMEVAFRLVRSVTVIQTVPKTVLMSYIVKVRMDDYLKKITSSQNSQRGSHQSDFGKSCVQLEKLLVTLGNCSVVSFNILLPQNVNSYTILDMIDSSSACHADEFACDSKCLPLRFKCNQEYDCLDRSDEKNCRKFCVCVSSVTRLLNVHDPQSPDKICPTHTKIHDINSST